MLASTHCLDCGTELSQERWSGGLCPRCLLVMALEESPSSGPDRLTEAPTLAFPPTTIAPGEIPGNRYRIHSLLGRGGMGEVWRAFDLKLRVDVALKALRKELLEDNHALELLRQEVRAAREVMSPNVCRVFDLEELDGQELVSMEYIDGTTLLEILREKGPLELEEAREIASQFLAGLEAIHQADLVHRDVKPENIMLTRSGRVVVMDFGVAKRLADKKLGSIAGTPAYMSPEQIKGQQIDARADVFSAGVVLAEMIAPEGIRSSEAREKLWRGVHHNPPELPESPWLGVLKRAVTPSLEERYASASVLARALEEVTLRIEGAEEVQPYPGLAAFTEEDAEYFFGRELEVEEMWKKLRRPHLLALIGPSGAGKSSFLRAGLIPTMPEGWRVVISTPGNRPFRTLAQRLVPEFEGDTEALTALLDLEEMEVAVPLVARWRERHKQALVIVDQFEELFTQNPEEVQGRFAELLGRLALEADVHVLLSMRDDFLYHCHAYPSLTPLLDGLTLLSPPIGAALRRAVVQPALKCGYRFEDEELVDEILKEVEEERGALPMLAFAAARLWEKRDRESGLLTRETYQEIGGVSGSLAQHAEATLERIGGDRIPIVREIFRNLVTAQGTRAARDRDELLSVFEDGLGQDVGAGLAPAREGTRPSPTLAGKATDRDAAAQVLKTLIDARLLTSYEVPPAENEDTGHHRIEIIHESLLANWPRLVRWQSQDADSALLRDELRQAAQTWDQHERADDLLWTGTAFREYQLWRERYPGGLTETEEAFAQAMTTHATRRKRRRRIAVATVIVVLTGILTIVSALWRQSEKAKEEAIAEARRAEAAKLLALGRLDLDEHPTAAVAYALASLELLDEPTTRLFALEALARGPAAIVRSYDNTSNRVSFSPDSAWLGVGSKSPGVELVPRDGSAAIYLGESEVGNTTVRFGPKSELAVWADPGNQRLRVWSIPEAKELDALDFQGPTIFLLTEKLLTGTATDEGAVVRVWSLSSGYPEEQCAWNLAHFSIGAWDLDSSGTNLAYSQGSKVYIRSFERCGVSPLRMLGEHPAPVFDVKFGPQESQLTSNDRSGEIRLWSLDLESAEPHRVIQAADTGGLAVDPTGSKLAMRVGSQPTVELWDLAGPPEADPMVLRSADVYWTAHLGFGPSGRWLATAHADQIRLWPVGREYPRVLHHKGRILGLAFTPDGRWLASASTNGTVRLWPLTSEAGHRSRELLDQAGVFPDMDIDSRGRNLLVAGGRGAWVVPLDGNPPRELVGFSASNVCVVAFGPRDRLAAAAPSIGAGEEKAVRIWDLESGEMRTLGPLPGAEDGVGGFVGLEFTSDGRVVTMGSTGLQIWDLEDGTFEEIRQESRANFYMAMSPDRQHLLTSTSTPGDNEARNAAVTTYDLELGGSLELPAFSSRAQAVAFDASGTVGVVGAYDGVVRVGRLTTAEEPHILPGAVGPVEAVAIDPTGHWVAASSRDSTVRLWPMPDMDKPPFHTLPYGELLAKLRTLTNLRVVEDEESTTGYKVEPGPFPGWEEVPIW